MVFSTANSAPNRIIPEQGYLAGILHVEPADSVVDISNRLKEVYSKLDARLNSAVSAVCDPNEAELVKSWAQIKKSFDIAELPGMTSSVSLKNPKSKAAFENLVKFSDSLIELDAELRDALKVIVNHRLIDQAFPIPPQWLKTARVMLSQPNFDNLQARFFMTNDEVKALAVESVKARSYQTEVGLKKFADIGLTWKHFKQSDPRFQLQAGWEPCLLNCNTSILRMGATSLAAAYRNLPPNIKRNTTLKQLLDMLDVPMNRPQIRIDLLKRLKREFPPPEKI